MNPPDHVFENAIIQEYLELRLRCYRQMNIGMVILLVLSHWFTPTAEFLVIILGVAYLLAIIMVGECCQSIARRHTENTRKYFMDPEHIRIRRSLLASCEHLTPSLFRLAKAIVLARYKPNSHKPKIGLLDRYWAKLNRIKY